VVHIPFRPALAWQYRKLWDDGWTAVDEGWLSNRFAQASYEILTLLLGVTQDGACAGPEGWVAAARVCWAAAFGREWYRNRTGYVVFPWGVLGAGEPLDEKPCFELHTPVAQKEERDLFLYG
jgi:hypothetical protein